MAKRAEKWPIRHHPRRFGYSYKQQKKKNRRQSKKPRSRKLPHTFLLTANRSIHLLITIIITCDHLHVHLSVCSEYFVCFIAQNHNNGKI